MRQFPVTVTLNSSFMSLSAVKLQPGKSHLFKGEGGFKS
jgi:hypothetical protein